MGVTLRARATEKLPPWFGSSEREQTIMDALANINLNYRTDVKASHFFLTQIGRNSFASRRDGTSRAAAGAMRNSGDRIDFIRDYLRAIFAEDVHAKRIDSLAGATLGVMTSASLAVSVMGQALAQARCRLS
jgi:hypothetical protein